MAKFGKWLGGGLGWALGGPIGAILGFAVGSAIDSVVSVDGDVVISHPNHRNKPNDFSLGLLVLIAAVMKADGKVVKSELDYVKQFFLKQFGSNHTQELLITLRDILQKEIPVHEVCLQIKTYTLYPARLQLIHLLFGVAAVDGHVHHNELNVIQQIASYLGIKPNDFASIKAMFFKEVDGDYKILEIDKDVTDEEVKKAYRRMAVKYHPDKVSHLGNEFQHSAKEKFQKVQEAYENIKKQRGLN